MQLLLLLDYEASRLRLTISYGVFQWKMRRINPALSLSVSKGAIIKPFYVRAVDVCGYGASSFVKLTIVINDYDADCGRRRGTRHEIPAHEENGKETRVMSRRFESFEERFSAGFRRFSNISFVSSLLTLKRRLRGYRMTTGVPDTC
jgi:hypothetical protein